jgi:mannose-6-phosphate isomerase-like protein (cupin superfamily)
MAALRSGRLADASAAPAEGERHVVLATPGGARIEQILTGRLAGPARFVGDEDEWVVVLSGSARIEAGGEVHDLAAGDWVLIPAGETHVLADAQPGTVWLAVHAPGHAEPAIHATAPRASAAPPPTRAQPRPGEWRVR